MVHLLSLKAERLVCCYVSRFPGELSVWARRTVVREGSDMRLRSQLQEKAFRNPPPSGAAPVPEVSVRMVPAAKAPESVEVQVEPVAALV